MKNRNYYLTTSGNQFAVIDKSPGHYQQVALCDTLEEAGEAINQHSQTDNTTKNYEPENNTNAQG